MNDEKNTKKSEKNDKPKSKAKKILGIVANVLIWIFVAFAVLTTILSFAAQGSADGVPELFGKSLLTIQTPSMDPVYKVGDMVIMTKADDDMRNSLKEGDIITYRLPVDVGGLESGSLNTHYIDHFTEDGNIVTKGAANELVDPYELSKYDVIGVSNGKPIRGLGAVVDFFCSSLGFFLCVVLPLVLFFLYELYRFISLVVTEKTKKNAAKVAPETEEEIKRRAIEEYLKAQAEQNANNTDAAATGDTTVENNDGDNAPIEK